VEFYHTDDAKCAEEFGVEAPAEVIFKKIEDPQITYDGPLNSRLFRNWYKPLQVPHLFKFTEDQISLVFDNNLNASVLFRTPDDDDAPYTKVFDDASIANRGKLMFAYSDMTDPIQSKLMEFVGLKVEDLPAMVIILPDQMQKFKFKGDI